jgi:hypothetical protein
MLALPLLRPERGAGMTRNDKSEGSKSNRSAHPHSWIWLVMAVIALSGITNAIG